MSEYDKLVKWLTKIADHSPYLALGSNHLAKVGEAAQAIERLERRATFIEHQHPESLEPYFSEAMGLLTTRKAFRKSEIAQLLAEQMQQLAEARAEIGRKDKVLEFTDSQLTNLQPHIVQACIPGHAGFIDNYVDPVLEKVREALATPAPSLVGCAACGGIGQIDPGSAAACPICDGAGKVTPDKNELPAPSTGEAERRPHICEAVSPKTDCETCGKPMRQPEPTSEAEKE